MPGCVAQTGLSVCTSCIFFKQDVLVVFDLHSEVLVVFASFFKSWDVTMVNRDILGKTPL